MTKSSERVPAEAMVDEFDAMARWTRDAVIDLGPTYALPAACRGSGGPAALDWLVDRLGLADGVELLDVGAGVGGPAEYAARTSGASPLILDPMPAACQAAAWLFDRPVVVGDGAHLPFPDNSFGTAWSLGVLCTVRDKSAHLLELSRVLNAGGHLGLLVFERTVVELPDQPEGNSFPTSSEVSELLRRTGFVVAATALVADLPPAPDHWQEAARRVDTWIAERYGVSAAWQRARHQESLLGSLIEEGLVAGRLIVADAFDQRGHPLSE